MVNKPPANAGYVGLTPGLGRSPGGRYGNPLQYSCLKNPMDRGAWRGYSPWGRKESNRTERLSTYALCHYFVNWRLVCFHLISIQLGEEEEINS